MQEHCPKCSRVKKTKSSSKSKPFWEFFFLLFHCGVKMPRPGPRPYECVRRAWHSDRHQPIRGSLIKEIFRIVNEVHCSSTRKNREWQEKLPIVVLKAEEIMYSKANSEAEYSDLETLWDRVNDAINTIIRRDETTESGELLQPCIEAALHLGCTPRRSSRSQRNDAPRCYLKGTSVLDGNSNAKLFGNPLILQCPQYTPFDPIRSCLKDQDHIFQSRNSNQFKKFLMLPKNHTSRQTSTSSGSWSIYPLHYNNQIQPDDPKFHSSKPSIPNPHLMENDKTGLQQKCPPFFKLDSSDDICPSDHDRSLDKERRIECDLTLRLGSVVVPCATSVEKSWPVQIENGNRSTLEGRKFKSHLNK